MVEIGTALSEKCIDIIGNCVEVERHLTQQTMATAGRTRLMSIIEFIEEHGGADALDDATQATPEGSDAELPPIIDGEVEYTMDFLDSVRTLRHEYAVILFGKPPPAHIWCMFKHLLSIRENNMEAISKVAKQRKIPFISDEATIIFIANRYPIKFYKYLLDGNIFNLESPSFQLHDDFQSILKQRLEGKKVQLTYKDISEIFGITLSRVSHYIKSSNKAMIKDFINGSIPHPATNKAKILLEKGNIIDTMIQELLKIGRAFDGESGN